MQPSKIIHQCDEVKVAVEALIELLTEDLDWNKDEPPVSQTSRLAICSVELDEILRDIKADFEGLPTEKQTDVDEFINTLKK